MNTNTPKAAHLITCSCGQNNILVHASCVPNDASIYGYSSKFIVDGNGKLDHFDFVHCGKCGAKHSVEPFIMKFHKMTVKFAKQNISARLG